MSAADAKAVLARALNLEVSEIPSDAAIGRLPQWDSLAHVRLMISLEDALGRPPTTEEVVGIQSLSDLARLLEQGERAS